ncbi:hypothetical protein [Streptomyces varsoviensis]|uniref:hypothetical protein n=1 Tax=Streptomyces varsoviensis TaxID=67373 RepID=UPI000A8846A8|nr:hypothetical protein [Streptomyces varsoviensis]
MTDLPGGYIMPPSTVPMPAQVPIRAPQKAPLFFMAPRDFESIPHEKLLELIKGVDPHKASDVGRRLHEAADKIQKVADDLKTYMDEDRLPWEGEGGNAFRTWGGKMVSATRELSEFSGVAGKWLMEAATTLGEVKNAMPAYPSEAKALLDSFKKSGGNLGPELFRAPTPATKPDNLVELKPPTKQEAEKAQAHLDHEHAEAARLMRKLAGSYTASARYISDAKQPEFPPMPAGIMPPPVVTVEGLRHLETSGGTGSGDSAVTHRTLGSSSRASSSVPAEGGHSRSHSVDGGPSASHANTELTAMPTATHDRVLPSGGAPVPPTVTGPPTSPMAQPSQVVPPFTPVPPGSFRPTGGSKASPAERGPQGPGRSRFNEVPRGGSSRAPADGIVGGRPLPSPGGGPVSRIPRGTVIGAEPGLGGGTAQGRPLMGHGLGPGASPGGPSGAPSGRRVSSESGGVVGGNPQRRPGAGTGETFTPGGSGLVRGNAAGSVPPGRGPVAPPPGSRSRKNKPAGTRPGERPDYLVEDEETWRPANNRTSPPVID